MSDVDGDGMGVVSDVRSLWRVWGTAGGGSGTC
jgi:hypothetical protein